MTDTAAINSSQQSLQASPEKKKPRHNVKQSTELVGIPVLR